MSALSEQARHAIGQLWHRRARFELEAEARFAQLGDRLEKLDAHPDVIRMARQASADEARHAVLCRALAEHFGVHDPVVRHPDIGDALPEIAPSTLDARHRGVYEVIALSCVTETLSVALLNELVERAIEPVVRQTMHEILVDEVRHSRLGWAHLAAEQERGGLRCLGALLPHMLKGTVHEELFSDGDEPSYATILEGYGSLNRGSRRVVIGQALMTVVFPGLELFGMSAEAGRRWWDRHSASEALRMA